jgi:putative hydrolase of the HAD superfamily
LKTYRHLFFDLDNTLWDFKANAREAFRDVFDRLRLHTLFRDFDRFLEIYEKHNEYLWMEYRKGKLRKEHLREERMRMTFLELGVDDPVLAREVGDWYIREAPLKSNLFPGVHETLTYLSVRYKLYILTNGFTEIQIQKVKSCQLEQHFSKLFMAEMVGYQKPDRRLFEYAVKSIHARKAECLMIGDDPEADIRGAYHAGIDQVFFNPAHKHCVVDPTWTITSIPDLKEIL